MMVNETANYGAGSGDNTIVAVFDSYADAKQAEDALLEQGFQHQQIQLNPESDASLSANPSDSRTAGTSTSASDSDQQSGIMGFFTPCLEVTTTAAIIAIPIPNPSVADIAS